jgi:hypothetical protein
VNTIWFKNKRDEGIKYPEFYNPIPEVGLALILTAIECCIDEWASDTRSDVTFFADNYQPIFAEHLKNLDKFDDHTKAQGLLPKLLAELHDNGCINARADPLDHSTTRTMSPSVFDAAIKEFINGDGDSSDSGGECDSFNVVEVVEVCTAQSI